MTLFPPSLYRNVGGGLYLESPPPIFYSFHCSAHNERASLALAQAKSADIVHRNTATAGAGAGGPRGPMTRQGSGKDCVIS